MEHTEEHTEQHTDIDGCFDAEDRKWHRLWNLLDDPGEEHNLAEALPDKAKALGDRLTALIQAGRSR